MTNKKTIYADHSATTKARPEVINAMVDILQIDFGNPSSIHSFGRIAKQHLEAAREEISSAIKAEKEQIFFTSGGTESNNTVIFGLVKAFEEGKFKNKRKHIITSKIEHPSIKEPLEYLQNKGWEISWINVDKEGFLNLEELKKSIDKETLLVSIIHANNEIGTVQDLKKISSICNEKNVLFHTDAVQSFCKIPIDVSKIPIDFMTLSSHKIYGPKGAGALYIKTSENLSPLLIGGGQEKQLRPGTENLAGIVGFGLAAKLLNSEMKDLSKKLRLMQLELMENLKKIDSVILTGVNIEKVKENIPEEKYLYRLPGHISICVKDIEGENLILQMDLNGIATSSGSACSSGTMEPSHVLVALDTPNNYIRGSLRLTLGRENTVDDIIHITKSLEEIIKKLSKKAVASL